MRGGMGHEKTVVHQVVEVLSQQCADAGGTIAASQAVDAYWSCPGLSSHSHIVCHVLHLLL